MPVGRKTGPVGNVRQVGRAVGGVGRLAGKPKPDILQQLEEDAAALQQATYDNNLETATAYYRAELDTDYYCCVVFQTQEQKDAFLAGVKHPVEEDGDMYVSGTLLAKQLGVTLPEGVKWKKGQPKPKWAALSLPKYPGRSG